MTANAQLLNDMVDQFWRHLEGNADYLALGLKQFKHLDGNVLPVDDEGTISADDLPAIYVGEPEPESSEPKTAPRREDEVSITLQMGVIYPQSDSYEAHSSVTATAAVMTIQDVIGSEDAWRTRLGDASKISGYSWTIGPTNAVVHPRDFRHVMYWDAEFSVTLTKRRVFPAS